MFSSTNKNVSVVFFNKVSVFCQSNVIYKNITFSWVQKVPQCIDKDILGFL